MVLWQLCLVWEAIVFPVSYFVFVSFGCLADYSFFEGAMEMRNCLLNRAAVQMVILTCVRDNRRITRIWDPKTRNTERGESRVEFTFQRRWGDSWDTVIVFVLCITEAPSSRFQTTPQQSTCAAGDIRFLSDGSSSQKPRQLLRERDLRKKDAQKCFKNLQK